MLSAAQTLWDPNLPACLSVPRNKECALYRMPLSQPVQVSLFPQRDEEAKNDATAMAGNTGKIVKLQIAK